MKPLPEIHRQAIEMIASRYRQLGFKVPVNDGTSPAFRLVRGEAVYEPHVTVIQGDDTVRVVVVETDDSLCQGALERWREMARSGLPVFVFVPPGRIDEAEGLKLVSQVRAELMEYPRDRDQVAPYRGKRA